MNTKVAKSNYDLIIIVNNHIVYNIICVRSNIPIFAGK